MSIWFACSKIGNWSWLLLLWILFILGKWDEVGWIHFVELHPLGMSLKLGPIIECYTLHLINVFPGRVCGSQNFLQRLAFFLWATALGKILTTNNLCQLTLVVIDWRCMCKRDRETIDHLFLQCMVAIELWTMVFSCLGCIRSCQKVLWSS